MLMNFHVGRRQRVITSVISGVLWELRRDNSYLYLLKLFRSWHLKGVTCKALPKQKVVRPLGRLHNGVIVLVIEVAGAISELYE